MSKLAEEAYANGNFLLAAEIYERCLRDKHKKKHISLNLYYLYGDCLARSGRLKDAFDIYSFISNTLNDLIPIERLKNLSSCLIENFLKQQQQQQQQQEQQQNLLIDFENQQVLLKPQQQQQQQQQHHEQQLLLEEENYLNNNNNNNKQIKFHKKSTKNKEYNNNNNNNNKTFKILNKKIFKTNEKIFEKNLVFRKSIGKELSEINNSNNNNNNNNNKNNDSNNLRKKYTDPLLCPVCENILQSPVTTSCGITFCRECYQKQQKSNVNFIKLKPDVLVRRLVDKWWGTKYIHILQLNEKAYSFLKNDQLDEALKCSNESLQKCSVYINSLLLRSEILYKLKHYQSSLSDAENVLKICPVSAKAIYHKGLALMQLSKFEDAFIAYCVAASLDNKLISASYETNITKLLQSILKSDVRFNKIPSHSLKPYSMKRKPNSRRILKMSKNLNNINDKDEHSSYLLGNCTNDCDDKYNLEYISNDFSNTTVIKSLLDRIQEEIVKIRDYGNKTSFVQVETENIDISDFDCVLCCRTLWKPVVTPCGHTYCWVCLDRCMDYSSLCPLCMSPLLSRVENNCTSGDYPFSFMKKSVTQFVEVAMQRFIPECYERRCNQEIDIEPSVPVFICTTAFPQVPCPLFVYEPRYRLMVRRAIESGAREFGIVQHITGKARFSDIGTILEIKDSVLLSDGCTILSTIGCKRFKIISRHEKDGYETAKVEYIYDEAIPTHLMPFVSSLNANVLRKATKWFQSLGSSIKEEVLRSFGTMPLLEENWAEGGDGPAWAWWIIAILPLNQQLKLNILATTSFEKRLRAIVKTLDHLTGKVKRSQQNCVAVPCDGLPACQAVECCQQAIATTTSSDHSETVTRHDSNFML